MDSPMSAVPPLRNPVRQIGMSPDTTGDGAENRVLPDRAIRQSRLQPVPIDGPWL